MTTHPSLNRVDRPMSRPWMTLLGLLIALIIGITIGVVLPTWLPDMSASLVGSDAKGYWYLSRSSAFVAFVLLWLSMLFGLLITSQTARLWPGGPIAFDLHQHTSLLGLACALFHGLILLGDTYIGYTLPQVLLPFANPDYRPLWVGVGQLAIYGLALVGLTFYVRRWIGRRAWRLIHGLSFAVFGLALIHGLASGTDSSSVWAEWLYMLSGGSVLFLTLYRVLITQWDAD